LVLRSSSSPSVTATNGLRNREAALTNTSEELSVGTTVLRHALDLIADPYSLYLDAGPDVRRLLNETFFECFYIDDLEDATVLRITDDKTVMFADRHSAAETTQIGRRINPGPTAAMRICGRSLFRIKRFWWTWLGVTRNGMTCGNSKSSPPESNPTTLNRGDGSGNQPAGEAQAGPEHPTPTPPPHHR
jgi:hypothetical protein